MNRRTFLIYTGNSALLAMLAACGFQLRGSNGDTNLPFKRMLVGLPDTSPLGNELKRYIRANGTAIVTDPTQADSILEALAETRNKTILSLNSQGRVRDFTLTYLFRFSVKDSAGRVLLAPTEILVKRDISYNESQALAKEAEEALIYRDMQSDLVQQILRRLTTIKLT